MALRNGLHPSDLSINNPDQEKIDFLAERMESFLEEFDNWDIRNDYEGLLDRVLEVLIDDSETFVSDSQSVAATPVPVLFYLIYN